ncbi:MAG: metalloregulator ArsR/SmtB family transcription factor [Candidatus Izemoplasma sp.]|nr:metalloregulator ArsR/SmtB family transcription factor [Candidatus Izemoplasma sp.]
MSKNHLSDLERTVNLFKIYSDYTRLRIIDLLSKAEHCVQEISLALDTSQSAISHQLKQLRDNNVVSARKEGKQVFYSLKDNHVKEIFLTAYSHITECDD